MADSTQNVEYRVVASVKADDSGDGLKQLALPRSNAMEVEDQFIRHLEPTLKDSIITPPYDPEALRTVVKENNSLRQCIDAMEVNIDGTGYKFVTDDEAEETDQEDEKIKEITGFFKEVWPGESFISQRRKIRREAEEIGYAFLEIIRNPTDDILFTRVIPSHTMRLVKLDAAVPVDKMVYRNGKEVSTKVLVRERRFLQKVGDKYIFFREYGTSRDVDKMTGEWGESGRLKAPLRGSEVLYFTIHKDSNSPYGVPRWINQTPSVIGSRKAEEMNLSYFDNDGIPPALVFLHGTLTGDGTKESIEAVLNQKKKDRLRAAVIEISSTEGSLDKGGSARVQVEKFATEQQSDAMFSDYDTKCEQRVRSSFRLPPLFVGRTEGYNYATAYASYAVAEAQIFAPERDEFDELITITLLRGMGYIGYALKSNPLSISDAVVQLKGIEMAGDKISPENKLGAINNTCNLDLQYDEETANAAAEAAANALRANLGDDDEEEDPKGGKNIPAPKGKSNTEATSEGSPLAKMDSIDLFALATDYATLLQVRDGTLTPKMKKATKAAVDMLGDQDRVAMDYLLATIIYPGLERDTEGLIELAHNACTCIEE